MGYSLFGGGELKSLFCLLQGEDSMYFDDSSKEFITFVAGNGCGS